MIDPSRYTRDELEKLAITQDALIRSLEGEIARLRVTEQEVKRLLARTMLRWDAETAKAATLEAERDAALARVRLDGETPERSHRSIVREKLEQ